MRLPLLHVLFVRLVAGAACLGAAGSVAAAPSRAEEVLAADADWAKAFVACDLKRMTRLVSDDLTMINLGGVVVSKDAFLKTVGLCSMVEGQPQNVKVRLYGDTAAVVGALQYRMKGQATSAMQVYTRMFVRQNGEWRLVSDSHTPVPAASAKK